MIVCVCVCVCVCVHMCVCEHVHVCTYIIHNVLEKGEGEDSWGYLVLLLISYWLLSPQNMSMLTTELEKYTQQEKERTPKEGASGSSETSQDQKQP